VPEPVAQQPLRGLVVDWGGVLTRDLDGALTQWAAAVGIDMERFRSVMREWLEAAGDAEAMVNPVHALERGEMAVDDFERRLADALTVDTLAPIGADGLLARMQQCFEHAPEMAALVRRAHDVDIRTALLSNSWGNDYPTDGWDDMFDAVVISGQVGMRKPEPAIFAHTLDLLGLGAEECVFVDDLRHNVEAAVRLGFVGVIHSSYAETAADLDVLFGRLLSR